MCAGGMTAFLPLAASCSMALSRAWAAFAFRASLAAACPCRLSSMVIGFCKEHGPTVSATGLQEYKKM